MITVEQKKAMTSQEDLNYWFERAKNLEDDSQEAEILAEMDRLQPKASKAYWDCGFGGINGENSIRYGLISPRTGLAYIVTETDKGRTIEPAWECPENAKK